MNDVKIFEVYRSSNKHKGGSEFSTIEMSLKGINQRRNDPGKEHIPEWIPLFLERPTAT